MPSVRLRGVRARVSEKNVLEKVKKIRALLGTDYKIVIEKDKVTVEGNLQDYELRKKIVRILAG